MSRVNLLRILTAIMLTALSVRSVKAESATPEEMQQVCQNWLSYMVHEKGGWAGEAEPKIVDVQEIVMNDMVLARCFSIAPRGHVVVPVLKELPPVKAYSEEYGLDVNQTVGFPQLLREVLKHRLNLFIDRYGSLNASQPLTGNVLFDRVNRREWDRFLREPHRLKGGLHVGAFAPLTEVGPLLTSAWHQSGPYNDLCPMGDGDRTLVGCVATAAAQIFNYHEWPPNGVGDHAYYWDGDDSCGASPPYPGAGPLAADFSDAYDWANMPDDCTPSSPQVEQDAVAELCYEVGVAFEMDYGVCGSGTWTYYALGALPTYFRYAASIDREDRYEHTAGTWFELIKAEIDAGRPMLYRIVGHAIVCDGWREAGGQDYYHINYGWGGPHTEWYAIDNIYGSSNAMEEYLIRNIGPADALDVRFESVPSGPDAYEPGDEPSFYWEVRTSDGELCCDCELQLYITPPNPYVTPIPVSCGRWEYGTPAVPASNWQFGCGCYTFLAVATHPAYASRQAVLEFHTCPPCPPECPAVIITSLTVSPHTIVPGCGDTQIDYCINVDARVSIWVRNSNGQVVREIEAPIPPDHNRTAGCSTDWWDALDDQGQPVPPGDYTVDIEAIHLDPAHPMFRFAPTGPGECEVGEVRGLAYDTDFVYVLTRAWGENKIVRYDRDDGTCVPPEYVLPEYVPPNPDPGETSPYIRGMVRDPQGRLYIGDDQPLPRVTVWDAVGWPPTWMCQVGYGQMHWPDGSEFAPIAYDPFADRILTWARYNQVDDRIFAFDAPCGPLDCDLDPTPGQNQPLWASGLAVDADGNVWLSRAGGTDVFESPCGPIFRTCTAINNARISFRYGRLLYSVEGGLIQVHDLRCNTLQNLCIHNSNFVLAEERFIVTPEGRYVYTVGRPCGDSGDIRCVRIQDCNSATYRTEPISVVQGALTVTEPNGGECWVTNTTQCISWATCGTVDNVTIRLYDGSDEVPDVSPLAECIADSGTYCWEIPHTLPCGQSYRIRVEDCLDPSTIYDLSDAPFSVTDRMGDADCNGDVDLEDFAAFEDCITGPGAGPVGVECHWADFGGDDDIDLSDFAGFQEAFTGAGP